MKYLNNNDGYLFSEQMREEFAPFGKMEVREALECEEFMCALYKHSDEFVSVLCKQVGMSENEINSTLEGDNVR